MMTEQEGIDQLRKEIPAGEEFGVSTVQRLLFWGYNRAFRTMQLAQETGQVERGDTAYRFKFAEPPINLNPFSEACIESMAQRNRFIAAQVARNKNGLTRGRKRHKKHRRALAIRKLLQMAPPSIFTDPQGDTGLLKKMLQAGQAQGRKDDVCQYTFQGQKITIIDVGPAHRSLAAHLRATGQTAE